MAAWYLLKKHSLPPPDPSGGVVYLRIVLSPEEVSHLILTKRKSLWVIMCLGKERTSRLYVMVHIIVWRLVEIVVKPRAKSHQPIYIYQNVGCTAECRYWIESGAAVQCQEQSGVSRRAEQVSCGSQVSGSKSEMTLTFQPSAWSTLNAHDTRAVCLSS